MDHTPLFNKINIVSRDDNSHNDWILSYIAENSGAINAMDKFKCTPLHRAAFYGNADLVERLIQVEGVDLNLKDCEGDTPLNIAIARNASDVVEKLVNSKKDIVINYVNNKGYSYTPLYIATKPNQELREENVSIIRSLLTHPGINVNIADHDGNTALHRIATCYGKECIDIMNLLLNSEKMDLGTINAINNNNNTPLHLAVEKLKNAPMVKSLLEKGADPTKVDQYGQTPLHLAVQANNLEAVRLLLEKEEVVETCLNLPAYGETPLYCATKKGNVEIMKLLLEKEALVNKAYTKSKNAPIHIVFRSSEYTDESKRENVLKLLLEHGADINSQGQYNCTPLHLAIQNNKLTMLQSLIEKKPRLDLKNDENYTPLEYAKAIKADIKIITALTNAQGELRGEKKVEPMVPSNVGKDVHKNPLVIADDPKPLKNKISNKITNQEEFFEALDKASQDNDNILDYISKNKNAINATNEYGFTPLHQAAFYGNAALVEELLKVEGVKPTQKNNNKYTPLSVAIGNNHVEVVQKFINSNKNVGINLSNGVDDAPLHEAISGTGTKLTDNNVKIVKLLVEDPKSLIDRRNVNGETPLHLITRYSGVHAIEIMKILLNSEKMSVEVINAVNKDKQDTALHVAVKGTEIAMLELLLAKGADPTKANINGETPLHAAIQNNNSNMVELLLAKEAVVTKCLNLQNSEGNTPLHLAALKVNIAMMQLLLDKKASVNDVNKISSNTPIHCAVLSGNQEAVNLLILNGADINSKGKDNFTPLHFAIEKRNLLMVKLLIEKNARLDYQNSEGLTPLAYAKKIKKSGSIKTIIEVLEQAQGKPKDKKEPIAPLRNPNKRINSNSRGVGDKDAVPNNPIAQMPNDNSVVLTPQKDERDTSPNATAQVIENPPATFIPCNDEKSTGSTSTPLSPSTTIPEKPHDTHGFKKWALYGFAASSVLFIPLYLSDKYGYLSANSHAPFKYFAGISSSYKSLAMKFTISSVVIIGVFSILAAAIDHNRS